MGRHPTPDFNLETVWQRILHLPLLEAQPVLCAVIGCKFEARQRRLCQGHYVAAYNLAREINPDPLPNNFTGLVIKYYERNYSTVHFMIDGIIRCDPQSKLERYKEANPDTAFDDVCKRCRLTAEGLGFFTNRKLPRHPLPKANQTKDTNDVLY